MRYRRAGPAAGGPMYYILDGLKRLLVGAGFPGLGMRRSP